MFLMHVGVRFFLHQRFIYSLMVIQRRGYYNEIPQVFNRSWYQYSVRFGNDKIFALTNYKDVELRVDLEDFNGKTC
ncbi:techylectin-5B-like [Tachypleus tridentatus]|uniref:techylectin-5B-like n=1 Tax=Tachypleus tridentatus TaxID=6853 RepID=UPI003FD3A6F1